MAWWLVVAPDRRYFDFVCAEAEDGVALAFPAHAPVRRFALNGVQMLIGRRSVSRGLTPEVDLTGPPEDPGVGRSHALLVAGDGDEDGRWSVVDLGSVNGTYLNYGTAPLVAHVPVPIAPGDRIHVGVWTTLAVELDD